MTKTDSISAIPVETGMALFRIGMDAEAALDHLERLVRMSSTKLEALSLHTCKETILAETEDTQTLLESVSLYLKQFEGVVEAIYNQSRAFPYIGEDDGSAKE